MFMIFIENRCLYKFFPNEFAKWMNLVEIGRNRLSKTTTEVKKKYELLPWVTYVDLLVDYLNSKLKLTLSNCPEPCKQILGLLKSMSLATNAGWVQSKWSWIADYLDIDYLTNSKPTIPLFKEFMSSLPSDFSYGDIKNKRDLLNYYKSLLEQLKASSVINNFAHDIAGNNSPIAIDESRWVFVASWEFWGDIDAYLSQFNQRAQQLGLLPLDQETLVKKFITIVNEKVISNWEDKKIKRKPANWSLSFKDRRASDALIKKCNTRIEKAKKQEGDFKKITLLIYDAILECDKIKNKYLYQKVATIIRNNLSSIELYYMVLDKTKKDPKYDLENNVIAILCHGNYFQEAERFIDSVYSFVRMYSIALQSWQGESWVNKPWRVFIACPDRFPELSEWETGAPNYLGNYFLHRVLKFLEKWPDSDFVNIVNKIEELQGDLKVNLSKDYRLLLNLFNSFIPKWIDDKNGILDSIIEILNTAVKIGFTTSELVLLSNTIIKYLKNKFWNDIDDIIEGAGLGELLKRNL